MKHSDTERAELVAVLLDEIARALRFLSSEDLAEIRAGRARVRFFVEGAQERGRKKRSSTAPVRPEELERLVSSLRGTSSREDGLRILDALAPTRDVLVLVCRYLDIPARKSDASDRLRERIVEATIGYRLNSDAIQGISGRPA